MPDPRVDPPEPKLTAKIEKSDIIQAQLSQVLTAIREHRAETTDNFTKLSANVDLVSNDLGLVKERIGIIETWRADIDTKAAKYSGGVRALSASDAGQNMQIASLAVKVDDLTKSQELQLAILTRLDAVVKNPTVKLIATALGTAALSWAAAKGLK